MKIRISSTIFNTLICIFFACFYILPSFSTTYNFIIPLGAGLSYVGFVTLKKKLHMSKYMAYQLLGVLIVALLYTFLTDATSISQAVSNMGLKRFLSKFYQIFLMFLPTFLLKNVIKYSTYKEKKLIMILSILLFSYVLILTTNELLINPDITRSWSEFEESSGSNIGNYYFVYAVPFIISLFVLYFLKVKNILYKLLLFCLILFLFYFLLLSQYTLAVLISMLGVFLTILYNTKLTMNRVVLIILFFIFLLLSPALLDYAIKNVPSEQMSIRLSEIKDFIIGGDASGYNLSSRLNLYSMAIKSFFSSPIFGNRSLSFDGHSTFLMLFADLGILGGIPYALLYVRAIRETKKILKSNVIKSFIVMLLLMGFTNPIHNALPLMFVLWFVVPLGIFIFQNKEG